MLPVPSDKPAAVGLDPELPNDGARSHGSSPIMGGGRDGNLKVRALGLGQSFSVDIYYRLMRMSWLSLGSLFVGLFVTFNVVFASLYGMDPAGLATNGPEIAVPMFWRNFFFSVHTVATIGYGNIYPVSLWANAVVVAEVTLGIIVFALATGIAFARFSRPTARILFSRRMVVHTVGNVPTLMLRAANQRHNVIYSAAARLSLMVDGDVGGVRMRRFVDLALIRQSNPAFQLTWTIMHPINPDSPLRHWLANPEAHHEDEIIVILSGTDEVSGQTIHGRWAYCAADISWGFRFADIVSIAPDGWRTIDYGRFHDVLPG